ncbi:translation initiation factor 3 subunit M [Mytilus galloprovincialis]|uniref:Eukaryotic translation initiation factor 3 subunit M n=1 Tax=Mytilus galloprovincialis TaxID=29158 RepID=A0A8B6FAS4_MYTGA|nr:translation initiation factor 3 subunit M [Mytilus galloprovincialis]
MSIPVFIDLPINEQVLELRGYLKEVGADISAEALEGNSLGDLRQIIEASKYLWENLNNDADLEMTMNSIISLVLVLPPDQIQEPVLQFCEAVAKSSSGDKRASLRIKLLSNLFSGLDEKSSSRADVYLCLVKLAHQTDLLYLVNTNLTNVKKWAKQWDVSSTKYQNILRSLHDALLDTKTSEAATKVMIDLLGTYTEDNASQAKNDAHRCIVTHLVDPNTFLMDHLLLLKPVKFLEGELIHDLLSIFVSGTITQYQQFYKTNTDFVKSLGLSHDQNLRKMRMLTFMQMSENKKELDYSVIQKELDLQESDIEEFIIDILRTKSVRVKIDQMQKKVVIHSSIHRQFGRQHWQMIQQSLLHWRDNLDTVQTSLKQLDMLRTQQVGAQ